MLSVLPAEMASQSKMIEKEEKLGKKRKPTSTINSSKGVPKKVQADENTDTSTKETNKKDTKDTTKGNVKSELKEQSKPSVILDKEEGLDVYVPVCLGDMLDFQSLRGLINIHFYFHNK